MPLSAFASGYVFASARMNNRKRSFATNAQIFLPLLGGEGRGEGGPTVVRSSTFESQRHGQAPPLNFTEPNDRPDRLIVYMTRWLGIPRSYRVLFGWLLLIASVLVTQAGVVETLDGKTIRGKIELGSGTLLVASANESPILVPLSNLRRADFRVPANTNRPVDKSRSGQAAWDENRGALPPPWRSDDIGQMKKRGAFEHYHGTFTLEAHPRAHKGRDDVLHFIHQPWHGDGEFIARVASLEPRDAREKQARAGVMLRASLEPESPSVSMSISGGLGSVFRRKSRKGEKVIDDPRPDLKPPYWVKLVRDGGAIAGFQSTDGHNWKLLGSSETDLPEKILVGLAVTSFRRERALATLDHVAFRSVVPRAAFAPRIVLRDGTVLADHFAAIDESNVTLSKAKRGLKFRTADVARLLFQPDFEANALTPGRVGVLMSNGDFIDGDFRGIQAGWVKISSVLLGQRRYELNRKIAAVLLRDVAPRATALEVATQDGSLWRTERLAFEKDTLALSTPLLGEWRIPADEVMEIRRTSASAR